MNKSSEGGSKKIRIRTTNLESKKSAKDQDSSDRKTHTKEKTKGNMSEDQLEKREPDMITVIILHLNTDHCEFPF